MRRTLFILLLTLSTSVFAQNAAVAKYKAMFTLNFIRYIGWPEAAKQGDFVIGVVGSTDVLKNLQAQTVGKKFGFQNIVVKAFNSVDEITDCQILFFSKSENFSKNAVTVKQKLGGKNSLIITETEGATKNGSMINFVIRSDQLKFELSAANAEAFGLKFSNSLTSLKNAIEK